MKTVNDIPDLFDSQDANDKRILINVPGEPHTYLLEGEYFVNKTSLKVPSH